MHLKDYPINKTPIHTHKGKNYFRFFSLMLLISITIFASILTFDYGFVFIPIILVALFGIFCVRFPRLTIYDERIVIEKKGLLTKFNDFDSFMYNELDTVEFSEGFTDWNYLIVLALLGSGGFGGNSKADQMIIRTKAGETTVYNRFGSRKGFIAAINIVKGFLS
jgi:hypothetical protein